MSANKTPSRIIVALVAIPLIIAAVLYGGYFFLAFILGIGILGFHEYANMLKEKGSSVQKYLGGFAVAALILNAYFNVILTGQLFTLATVLILLAGLRWKSGSPIADIGGTLFGTAYIGLFLASLIEIREFYNYSDLTYANGGWLIIGMFASIWACDSGAFFLGIAFGKNKLYPKVSPKKSWEGALAGFVFSLLAMVVVKYFFLDFLSWGLAMAIGVTIGIIGQAGDFVESLIKRDSGVKDSSTLIPGHGGVLDRFDSLLFSAPVVYLILLFFGK